MTTFQLGEKENQLLFSIYAAALSPEKWRSVLEDIVAHIGADLGQLIFVDERSAERNFIESSSCNDVQSSLFSPDLHQIKTLLCGSIEGSVIEQRLVKEASTKIAEQNQILISLINNDVAASSLGFYSSSNDFQFSLESLQFLQRLAPHIARAMHIYQQISVVKNVNNSLIESLKCSNLCVLLLDAERRVVFVTEAAKHLLEKSPALQINYQHQLRIKDSKQQEQLEYYLSRLMDAQVALTASSGAVDDAAKFSLPVHLPDKVHPLKLTGVLLSPTQSRTANVAHAAIFISDPERRRQIPQEYLQQAFGFTRTELLIAQLLLNGFSINEIATKRRTTLETVRGQLKSILHKTGSANQAELTRLLMLLSHDLPTNVMVIDQSETHTTHLGDD